MTRWNEPGRCKTRLARSIGEHHAYLIQDKLTIHTLSVAEILKERNLIEIHLAVAGLPDTKRRQYGLDHGFKTVANQRDGDLGKRIIDQLILAEENSEENIDKINIIVIGTDLPTLSHQDLLIGIQLLSKYDMIIGPSSDGGYWLVGFSGNQLQKGINWSFEDITWGTNKVLEETLQKANDRNIKYKLLREQNDLDIVEDLNPWQG